MKTGLVMEGGAMRGMFTMGVTDVLMTAGVAFDGGIGVSAGAGFGCNYKSRQIGRAIRYSIRFAKDWRYASWRSFFLTGDMFGAKFLYDTVPYHLDPFDIDEFKKNPMRFWCVVTDCESGEAVAHELTKADPEDMLWLRASASMPIVSTPVLIDGRRYLDGGIADSIPLKRFEDMGYEKNVVILTQPRDFVKPKQNHTALLKRSLRNFPKAYDDLMKRHVTYMEERMYVEKRVREGKALAVYPPKALDIPSVCHKPEELMRVYLEGVKTGKQVLPALQAFLAS